MKTITNKHLPWIVLLTLILTGCEGLLLPSFNSESTIPSSALVSSESLSSSIETTQSSEISSSSEIDSSSSDASESSLLSTSTSEESQSSSSSPSSASPSSSNSELNYNYSGYYSGLQGLTDSQLMSTLRPLLRQALGSDGLFPNTVTYETAITALQNSDKDPSNTNNVIIWYRMTSVSKTWDSGTTWNREHVWPQSLMSVSTSNSSRHKGADAHNLKPANPSDNSSRGNKYFSETSSTASYVPPASIRGDIARILFYMVTMYPELSLVDVTSGSPATYTMAQFSLMVKWHLQDPVDDFEARRNQILYQHQNNRNPFIDHEELVCRMFRNQTSQALQYCQA